MELKDLVLGIISAANELSIHVYAFHISTLAYIVADDKKELGKPELFDFGIEYRKIGWLLNKMLFMKEVEYDFDRGYYVSKPIKNQYYKKARRYLSGNSINKLLIEIKRRFIEENYKF